MLVSFEELIEDSIVVLEDVGTRLVIQYTQTIVTTAKLSVISNYALQVDTSEHAEIHKLIQ